MNNKLYNEDIYYISDTNEKLPFFITIAGISYCDGSYHIVRKNSKVVTVEYIVDGCGFVSSNGEKHFAEKGDIYILPMYTNHDYYSDDETPWTKIWFNASGPLVDAIINSYGLQNKIIIKNSDAKQYFDEMLSVCKGILPISEINERCALIFHQLIAYLSNFISDSQVTLSGEAIKIKEYIDTHLDENVSTETLASIIFKSKSQVIRIFKNEFGTTPYNYLLDRRLIKAKSLLVNTNLLIKEIAYIVGFSDEHYFSDIFKRKCGITPGSYRTKN